MLVTLVSLTTFVLLEPLELPDELPVEDVPVVVVEEVDVSMEEAALTPDMINLMES